VGGLEEWEIEWVHRRGYRWICGWAGGGAGGTGCKGQEGLGLGNEQGRRNGEKGHLVIGLTEVSPKGVWGKGKDVRQQLGT